MRPCRQSAIGSHPRWLPDDHRVGKTWFIGFDPGGPLQLRGRAIMRKLSRRSADGDLSRVVPANVTRQTGQRHGMCAHYGELDTVGFRAGCAALSATFVAY